VLLAVPAVLVAIWGVLFGAGGLETGAADLIAASTALPAGVVLGLIAIGWWPFHRPSLTALIAAGGLAAFTAIAALSGLWSLSANDSANTAILSAGYLGALSLGLLLGPLLRKPGTTFAGGMTGLATIASTWALVARSFATTTGVQFTPRLSGTLSLPNAMAFLALAGVFGGLGLSANANPRLRALGGAIASVNVLALVLTSSRSGLGLALIGIFAMQLMLPAAPRMRLIGLFAITPAVVFGFRIATWPAFTDTSKLVATAGIGLLAAAVSATILGAVIALVMPRLLPGAQPLGPRRRGSRRSVAIAAGSLAALLVGLVLRAGGPSAAVDAIRAGFTGPVGQSGVRIGIGSNLRDHWWETAWSGFVDAPLHGWGAGTFRLLEQTTRSPAFTTGSTHNTILEALAGTGLLGGIPFIAGGFALVILAIMGVRHPRRGDAVGSTVTAIVAIALLAQGLVDVDWSLAAAGVIIYAAIGAIAPNDLSHEPIRRRWRLPFGAASVILLSAGLVAVPFWLSDRQTIRSEYELLDHPYTALTLASSAHRYNPLSTASLVSQADALEQLGDSRGARAALLQAIRLEPKNYEPLLAYGTYLAYAWNDPEGGRRALERAAVLSGGDPSVTVVLETLPPPAP
jgi:hypothetical protein